MKTFKQFITEARPPKPDYLQTIANNAKRAKGVNLQLSSTPRGDTRVDGIHVKPEDQGQGRGTWAMNLVLRNAKRKGHNVLLTPSAKPGQERRLIKFYKNLGFKRLNSDSDAYRWTPN